MGISQDLTLVRRPPWILRVAALRTAVLGSDSGSRDRLPLPPYRVGIVGATAYGMGAAAIVLANAAKPTAMIATKSSTATATTAAKTTAMLATMPATTMTATTCQCVGRNGSTSQRDRRDNKCNLMQCELFHWLAFLCDWLSDRSSWSPPFEAIGSALLVPQPFKGPFATQMLGQVRKLIIVCSLHSLLNKSQELIGDGVSN